MFRVLIALCALTVFPLVSHADETAAEKAEVKAAETKDSAKKVVRDADDKACEMVNGKMHCAGKKAKHALKNTGDKIDTKVDEAKKKAD